MAELTIEQQRALALANARLRMQPGGETTSTETPAAVDPLAASMRAVDARAAMPDTSLTQNVKVAARAASPYATAAGIGALAGAPFGGPVGSAAGAGLATLGLGLGDLGAAGYNIAAPYFGGQRMPSPSETIQNLYGKVGIGAKPQTSEQAMLDAIISGAGGSGAQARALNALAPYARSPVTRNVMTEMGQQPVIQTAAGAGGAAAPTALKEYADINDPLSSMTASIVGSVLGGKAASGAGNLARTVQSTARAFETPSTADLKTQAQRAYAKADDAGVVYRPEAFDDFAINLRRNLTKEGFDAGLHPNVAVALDRIGGLTDTGIPGVGKPPTMQDLDTMRKVARAARSSENADERRLGVMLTNQLDNFALKPPGNSVFTGDVKQAASALTDARRLWSRMSKSSELEDAVERARLSPQGAEGKLDEAVRTQFATLAKEIDKGWHPGFTKDEVANIRQIAQGKTQKFGLTAISQLAPSTSLSGMARGAAQLAAGTAAGGPLGAGLAVGSMAAGQGARLGRNALADLYASNLAAGVRRGDVQTPFAVNATNMMSPAAQQMLLQSQQ